MWWMVGMMRSSACLLPSVMLHALLLLRQGLGRVSAAGVETVLGAAWSQLRVLVLTGCRAAEAWPCAVGEWHRASAHHLPRRRELWRPAHAPR